VVGSAAIKTKLQVIGLKHLGILKTVESGDESVERRAVFERFEPEGLAERPLPVVVEQPSGSVDVTFQDF
jgi:hypothetical protein